MTSADFCNLDDSLTHHGILGMKWGIRRYQNPDGTLTDAGLKRYSKKISRDMKNLSKTSKKFKIDTTKV